MSFDDGMSPLPTAKVNKVIKLGYVIPATEQDLLLLARLIQAEAEGEPREGKIAVGSVVVNRLRHQAFPNTITEVIFEHEQFESVANGRLNSIEKPGKEYIDAAQKALQGIDPTHGALFFFNPQKTQNMWLREKTITLALGNHVFVV